jgi:hypothetical protein
VRDSEHICISLQIPCSCDIQQAYLDGAVSIIVQLKKWEKIEIQHNETMLEREQQCLLKKHMCLLIALNYNYNVYQFNHSICMITC